MSNRAAIFTIGKRVFFQPFGNCSMNYDITAQELQNAIDNDRVVLLKSSLNNAGGEDVYGFTPKGRGRSFLKQLKNRFSL
jgi:hypothetical protein